MKEQIELVQALVECQKQFKNLGVNKKGFNYEYLTLDKLIDETRDILAQNGLVVVQTMRVTEGGRNLLKTSLLHVGGGLIEGEYVLEPVAVGKANAAQMMGASITYARRYTLAALLGIAQADSDGVNPNMPPVEPKKPATKPTPKATAPKFSEMQTKLGQDLRKAGIDPQKWAIEQAVVAWGELSDDACANYLMALENGDYNV